MHLCKEKYRLDLHWDSVNYDKEGVCKLNGAFFSGPVLVMARQIRPNDFILLDFYKQYLIFVKDVYVAKLSWGNVTYSDNLVKLNNATITHESEINRVPKFINSDYIVIDTEKHEEATHQHTFVYDSFVVNENDIEYRF